MSGAPMFVQNPEYRILRAPTAAPKLEPRINLGRTNTTLHLLVSDGRSEVQVDLRQVDALKLAQGLAAIVQSLNPTAPTVATVAPAKARRKARAVGFRPKAERD